MSRRYVCPSCAHPLQDEGSEAGSAWMCVLLATTGCDCDSCAVGAHVPVTSQQGVEAIEAAIDRDARFGGWAA